MTLHVPFESTYACLPDRFFARLAPTPVRAPKLIRLNRELADHLGLDPDWLASPEGVEVLAGRRIPDGAEPIALAYAGHQFGLFVPQLGDGRAILLGEVVDRDGKRRDIQLKGSGRTPFSRGGDGRAALGPVLREYVVSEAMAALGIPTTRSLAAVTTGETVVRETHLPGAVLTRVALSHIRVGTFQFFAARGDTEGVRLLADYVIARHYPEAAKAEPPYRALLEQVIAAQAVLIARWLLVGFIHGVMNTDNTSIAGETIDYGPCAFMDAYDPATVFSSIDSRGRYAFGNQPAIAQWNLTRLAETLLPLLDPKEERAVEIATQVLGGFAKKYQQHWLAGMRRKLGMFTEQPDDLALVETLLAWMHKTKADFTNTFAALSRNLPGDAPQRKDEEFRGWQERWLARLGQQPQSQPESEQLRRAHNPALIPRNHLVEAALAAAGENDLSRVNQLLEVLGTPYDHGRDAAEYREPAR